MTMLAQLNRSTTTPTNSTNIKPVDEPVPDSMVQALGGSQNTSEKSTNQQIWDAMPYADQVSVTQKINGVRNPVDYAPSPANGTTWFGNVQNNYQQETGGAYNANAALAAGMDPMEVVRMQAASASNNDREANEKEMSSFQLNDILRKDSPLMMLAAQDGIDYANRRGGANSSLAAGSSMREMSRQATPLAMQQAEVEHATGMQNQGLESARREANAGREQQSSMFNADAENQATSQEFSSEANRRSNNAALQTDTNIKNAAMSNDMMAQDRKNTLSMALQQLSGDQDYVKQHMASTLAKELAVIEGDYKTIISNNDSASRVLTSMTGAVADILGNNNIRGDTAEVKIQAVIDNTKDALGVIGAMTDLDLSNYLNDVASMRT